MIFKKKIIQEPQTYQSASMAVNIMLTGKNQRRNFHRSYHLRSNLKVDLH